MLFSIHKNHYMTAGTLVRFVIHILLFTIVFGWPLPGRCQDSLGFPPNGKVKINFQAHELSPSWLPFDVPFKLYAAIPDSAGVDSIQITCTLFDGNDRQHHPRIDPVQLIQSGTKGVVDLYTLTLRRNNAAIPSDTLIGDISVPLKPTKYYNFSFKLFRRVLPTEAADLVKMIDPIVLNRVLYIYRDAGTNASNINMKLDFTLHPLLDIVQPITDSIVEYYRKKHLYRQSPALDLDVPILLGEFIDNYRVSLRDKLAAFAEVGTKRDQDVDQFISHGHIQSWRLWKVTDSISKNKTLAAKYHIDSAQWKKFNNIMRDEDSLELYFSARTSNLQRGLWQDNGLTSTQVLDYKKTADSFYLFFASLCNQVKAIRAEGTLLNDLGAADRLLVEDNIQSICSPLMDAALQNTQVVHDCYDMSLKVDSLPKIYSFNFSMRLIADIANMTDGITSADFVTRGAWSMIADIGFAYINTYPTGTARPYVGVNFSFRPVNRQANFNLFKHPNYNFGQYFVNSLSIMVGLTVFNSFNSKDRFTDLFGTTGSLLTGISLRVSDGARISGGAMWAYLKDANPVSDQKHLTYIYYGSVSTDLTLKKWLGSLAKFFD
jgi:hypothetical protein